MPAIKASPKKRPTAHPEPAEIRALRISAGLTQAQAGALLHANLRSWQKWERGERAMHPAFWELFRLKTSVPDRE